jgi:SSS family solute:Na+ symporter
MMAYPDFLRFRYVDQVAVVAAIISALGYLGFTSGQILAGAKLMSGSRIDWAPPEMDVMTFFVLLVTGFPSPLGLDPSFWGILVSALFFVPISLALPAPSSRKEFSVG